VSADCGFCEIVRADEELVDSNTHAAAFLDAFPSAPGHTLVIPTRHVRRLHDLERFEMVAMWDLARTTLGAGTCCHTVGFNDGVHAGQTVPHIHMHIIPRTEGDVPDPRFGIRWVIPETAEYGR
jgi:diadenosine tetraphosphate (Ap4A) HIT family hydrolase